MGLGPYIGREYAHDLVYDICREALRQQRPLLDLLCEDAEIMRHVDRAALARMCDPANYLGQSGVMVALDPPTVRYVPLAQATHRMKVVPLDCDSILSARELGICLGD